jgi:hypothetical protein
VGLARVVGGIVGQVSIVTDDATAAPRDNLAKLFSLLLCPTKQVCVAHLPTSLITRLFITWSPS